MVFNNLQNLDQQFYIHNQYKKQDHKVNNIDQNHLDLKNELQLILDQQKQILRDQKQQQSQFINKYQEQQKLEQSQILKQLEDQKQIQIKDQEMNYNKLLENQKQQQNSLAIQDQLQQKYQSLLENEQKRRIEQNQQIDRTQQQIQQPLPNIGRQKQMDKQMKYKLRQQKQKRMKSMNENRKEQNEEDKQISEFELECQGVGGNELVDEFSYIKLNHEYLVASRSCGISVVIVDNCKQSNIRKYNETEKELLKNITQDIKMAKDYQLQKVKMACDQKFKTVKEKVLDNSVFQQTHVMLIECPSQCIIEIESTKVLYYRQFKELVYLNGDDRVCISAYENRLIDDHGGLLLLKQYDRNQETQEINKYIEEINVFDQFGTRSNYFYSIEQFRLFTYLPFIKKQPYLKEIYDKTGEENQTEIFIQTFQEIIQNAVNETNQMRSVDQSLYDKMVQDYEYQEVYVDQLDSVLKVTDSEQFSNMEIDQVYIKTLKEIQNQPEISNYLQLNPIINNQNFDNQVLFVKTFQICDNDGNIDETKSKELQRLKYLLGNLQKSLKIGIVSNGKWMSGSDYHLVELLVGIGINKEIEDYYNTYQNDRSQNDIAIAFIGELENEGYNQIINKKAVEKQDLNQVYKCEEKEEKEEGEEEDFKGCRNWSCRFMISLHNQVNEVMKDNEIVKQYEDTLNGLFKNTTQYLKYTVVDRSISLFKDQQYFLSQYLFDFPYVNQSKVYWDSQQYCNVHMTSSNQQSKIQFQDKEFEFQNDKEGILVLRISKKCQRTIEKDESIENDEKGLEKLNKLLQEFEIGDILVLVQHSKFDWLKKIKESSLQSIFEDFGFMNFEHLDQKIETMNLIFVGRKGLLLDNGFYQMGNNNVESSVNICKDSVFKICSNRHMYIRTEGNIENYEAPLKRRMLYFDNDEIANDEEIGMTLTVMACKSSSTQSKYVKLFQKNYDFIDEKESITELISSLKQYVKRNYIGKPLFILTTFGAYFKKDDKDQKKDWEELDKQIELLGGDKLVPYLEEEHFLVQNGQQKDIGHPYVFVGSNKLESYQGIEYKFRDDNNTFGELWIDLDSNNFTCPQKEVEFKDLVKKDDFLKQKGVDKMQDYVNELLGPNVDDTKIKDTIKKIQEEVKNKMNEQANKESDGQKVDGQKVDGQKVDGQKVDGQKSDGQKADGQKVDGQNSKANDQANKQNDQNGKPTDQANKPGDQNGKPSDQANKANDQNNPNLNTNKSDQKDNDQKQKTEDGNKGQKQQSQNEQSGKQNKNQSDQQKQGLNNAQNQIPPPPPPNNENMVASIIESIKAQLGKDVKIDLQKVMQNINQNISSLPPPPDDHHHDDHHHDISSSHKLHAVIVRGVVFGRSQDSIKEIQLDNISFCTRIKISEMMAEIVQLKTTTYKYPMVRCVASWEPRFNYDYKVKLITSQKNDEIIGLIGEVINLKDHYILRLFSEKYDRL